jgi:hypothetical protein
MWGGGAAMTGNKAGIGRILPFASIAFVASAVFGAATILAAPVNEKIVGKFAYTGSIQDFHAAPFFDTVTVNDTWWHCIPLPADSSMRARLG